MRIERFAAFGFPVPFKTVFRHAQGSRRRAENLIVAAYSADGAVGYGEGCPRRYVTGETVVGCLAFVREQADDLAARVTDAASLQAWIETKRCSIDRNPAAFCALEIAILDLIGKTEGRSLEAVAGVSPLAAAFHYSAVLGDAPPWLFRAQLRRYWRRGLRDFKVKLSDDAGRDQRKLAAFAKKSGRIRVRLDANNLWADVRPCVRHVAALRTSVFAIEEPLQVGDLAGFRAVGRACQARIILDESLLRAEQLDSIDDPERWIVNLRVSKMGGVLRTLTVAAKAQQRGIGVIVGCQVGETSILTRAGLAVMNARGPHLIAAEGAFGTFLLRRDLAAPCLMFGSGGVLEAAEVQWASAHGLGLVIDEQALVPHGGGASALGSPSD